MAIINLGSSLNLYNEVDSNKDGVLLKTECTNSKFKWEEVLKARGISDTKVASIKYGPDITIPGEGPGNPSLNIKFSDLDWIEKLKLLEADDARLDQNTAAYSDGNLDKWELLTQIFRVTLPPEYTDYDSLQILAHTPLEDGAYSYISIDSPNAEGMYGFPDLFIMTNKNNKDSLEYFQSKVGALNIATEDKLLEKSGIRRDDKSFPSRYFDKNEKELSILEALLILKNYAFIEDILVIPEAGQTNRSTGNKYRESRPDLWTDPAIETFLKNIEERKITFLELRYVDTPAKVRGTELISSEKRIYLVGRDINMNEIILGDVSYYNNYGIKITDIKGTNINHNYVEDPKALFEEINRQISEN